MLNDIVGTGLAYAPATDNLMKYGPPKSVGVFTRETVAVCDGWMTSDC